MKKKLYIIGAGTGEYSLLTQKAAEILKNCEEVYGTERISDLMQNIRGDIRKVSLQQMKESIVSSKAESIAALVTGDTGFYSMAKILQRDLSNDCDIKMLSGISSLQYLCARLGRSYEGIKTISLHGREGSPLGTVSYFPETFILTGGVRKAHDICAHLAENGLGHLTVTAGENLSMPQERIVQGTAQELACEIFSDLTVLLLDNPQHANREQAFSDTDFIRAKVPMTKQEVRWASVNMMRIAPTDIIYDIGAGTGSVSFEAARKAYSGLVYAVEQNEEGICLINENRIHTGGYNVIPVAGMAPEALSTLPPPDKAFIGGSKGHMRSVIKSLIEKNPEISVTVNAITLETLHEAITVLEEFGFKTEISCISVARAKQVGESHMMMANNPVYIIHGEKI